MGLWPYSQCTGTLSVGLRPHSQWTVWAARRPLRHSGQCPLSLFVLWIAGVLSLDGKVGAFADTAQIGGVRVTLSVPSGDSFTELMVSAPGALPRQIVIDTAVANAGLEWRPWKGGAAPVRLAQGNGIPSLSDAKAATMARGHLIPGGASLMRAAKLETLGLGGAYPAAHTPKGIP